MVMALYTESFGSRGSSTSLAGPLEQVNATSSPFPDTNSQLSVKSVQFNSSVDASPPAFKSTLLFNQLRPPHIQMNTVFLFHIWLLCVQSNLGDKAS